MTKKVLLVDDDRFTHELVKRNLEDYDVELSDAYTALEAFEELRSNKYDVALIDQKIDVMDGTDIIRSIKQLPLKTRMYCFTGYDKEWMQYHSKDIKDKISGVICKDHMVKEFKRLFEKNHE